MKIHRQILTEDDDNEVWDPVRIGAAIGFLSLIGLEFYAVIATGKPFDAQAFGIALGSYISGTGLALWASSHQKETPK